MSDASRFVTALRRRIPLSPVPFWELELHLAGEWVGNPLVLGENFLKLDAAGQKKVVSANADRV